MSGTLISPVPLVPSRDVTPAVRTALGRVENAFIGTVATCKTNYERLSYWRELSDFVSRNLANIDGQILAGDGEGGMGEAPAAAGGA